MKEKILAYVKDNCLFVSVIAVLMVIFCFFLWMTYCAGNSMEAETSYTDVTALSTSSSSKQSSQSLSEASSQSKTEGSEKDESKVTVDVKGAVANPGVYTLKASARVTDAIKAAGGMTEDADADAKSVNLAASLSDEEVVYVATKDENLSVLGQSGTGQVSDKGGQTSAKDGKINLNTATSEELQTISGIGAKRAEDIIAYRESHGGFQSIDDLKNVSGIGEKTLDKIRESLYVA